MQYANNGSLLSYLHKNINKLTWEDKLRHLRNIAQYLLVIHNEGLVHCDLHSGNIVVHDTTSGLNSRLRDVMFIGGSKHIITEEITSMIRIFICDLGLSRSVNSHESNSDIRGVLPFIAPEVFHTYTFTQKSDVYSFGIIMYLIATGEPPFRDREFDRSLVCDIMGGLRPSMPDSAPEKYKKLTERCWDADPDKRPDAKTLLGDTDKIINNVYKDNRDMWDAIYHNNVKPLSRLEKESKYSSKLLPTGDNLDSAAGMKTSSRLKLHQSQY